MDLAAESQNSGSLHFLVALSVHLLADLVAGLVILLLVDSRLRHRDQLRAAREHQAGLDRQAAEWQRLLKAALLQQYPPLMQRLLDTQRDAFACAVRGRIDAPHQHNLVEIASNIRHFANVQIDTIETLAALNGAVGSLSEHAELTNQMSKLALSLLRNPDSYPHACAGVKSALSSVTKSFGADRPSSTHLERMGLLLDDLEANVREFPNGDAGLRQELFCALAESMGHNTNLMLELLNQLFREAVAATTEEIRLPTMVDQPSESWLKGLTTPTKAGRTA